MNPLGEKLLLLLTDPTRYRGWLRLGFHPGFILLIGGWMSRFFFPFVPLQTTPLGLRVTLFSRDWVTVLLGYYGLVGVIVHTYRSGWRLAGGLLAYYILLYSLYAGSARLLDRFFPLQAGYEAGIGWYYVNVVHYFSRHGFWAQLVRPETALRLQSFVFSLVMLPLLLKVFLELLRTLGRNARLRQQNLQLELNFLRSQLQPHFLFNTLNSLYALSSQESPRSARLVVHLSDMLRYALYETGKDWVYLHQELTFLRNYLVLEGLRGAGRVRIESQLSGDDEGRLLIAPFILVPLVENAFKHGVHASRLTAWVKLHLSVDDGQLQMQLANSKVRYGLSADDSGIGLKNVRRRLDALYAGAYQLTIDDQLDMYSVQLCIHLRN